MSKTILIADDKAHIRKLAREYLEAEGFRVLIASDGREALYAVHQSQPDLILLDVMLPEMEGDDFIKACRAEIKAATILLTVSRDESNRVSVPELGADGYVIKPFVRKELVTRVNTILRRTGHSASGPETLAIGGIHLNRESRNVKSFGRPISLTPTEFDLLCALMSAPDQVFSRAELLHKLQDNTYEGTERSVDVHIRNLRAKIEPNSSEPIYIKTVFGAGYRFHSE